MFAKIPAYHYKKIFIKVRELQTQVNTSTFKLFITGQYQYIIDQCIKESAKQDTHI
jgi:hypothetical protein